jgi:hypothetical protein
MVCKECSWFLQTGSLLYDQQQFIEKLEIVDWRTLLCQFEDVDDMCNQFANTFLELARECIPAKDNYRKI